jgi:hypothetical protein
VNPASSKKIFAGLSPDCRNVPSANLPRPHVPGRVAARDSVYIHVSPRYLFGFCYYGCPWVSKSCRKEATPVHGLKTMKGALRNGEILLKAPRN